MAEDYRVGDGHVTDLRCVIVNMEYFCFESKKNLLKLLNCFCEKHFNRACGLCIDQGHKQRQQLLIKYFEVTKLWNDKFCRQYLYFHPISCNFFSCDCTNLGYLLLWLSAMLYPTFKLIG